QRKKLGAFYTPVPVVRFIVRSIDHILKSTFGLANGLADTSKIEVERDIQGKKRKEMVHQVQILDPAVGTGTFLNEIVQEIHKSFSGQEGRWRSYVDTDLLPRLHGFELMMAPYTIAHLKLGMTLRDTGYTAFSRRLGIYLTNSLEEGHLMGNDLFSFGLSQSIAEEAISASEIKNQTPIMVVTGNPPYSVSSSNKGDWILNLIKDYKKSLGERKINLDDDYIKFIRFSEQFIEKNGTGIVAMITNNSFIDGITHRQMRKHLLETFDDIYILDLHGNSKKKEKSPDGGKDENVFDIQQGVGISIFVRKSKNKKGLGKVYYSELYGKRSNKFETLNKMNLNNTKWEQLNYMDPYYFFVSKDFTLEKEYNKGFSVSDLFPIYNTGIQTKFDAVAIQFTKKEIKSVVDEFKMLTIPELTTKYGTKIGSGWNYESAKKDIIDNKHSIEVIHYRPFDMRFTSYSGKSGGFMGRSRANVMGSLLGIKDNYALIFTRQFGGGKHFIIFCSDKITEMASQPFASYLIAPLKILEKDGTISINLCKEIVEEFAAIIGNNSPEDIFNYVYGSLHSLSYTEKYREFLKIDFPRVSYPKDKKQFDALVALGQELRELHLLKSSVLNKFITTYPEDGDNLIEKISYKDEKVFINSKQYFGNVPEIAWNFYIGGYQPAQKWLKDRKGRTLSNEEIEHYQKMIVALVETERIMKEIDEVVSKTSII
ncbi:MAG: type ISP restriction/modification enzyme, partial [bacterium]|nr:type ISP restriction/modification enzyme [bacterium]